MRTPTARPPPGIIGHNRTMPTPHSCVFPPEGIMDSLLPAWPGRILRFQTSPGMGARSAQVLLIAPQGAGSAGAVHDGLEHVLDVLERAFLLDAAGRSETPVPGGFPRIPAGMPFALRATASGEARGPGEAPLCARRRDRAAGMARRPSRHRAARGRLPASAFPAARHQGPCDGFRDEHHVLRAPGALLAHRDWRIETHMMEHGLLMLRGKALLLLGRDRHELRAGDFVWLGPYLPQRIKATGSEVVECLLDKDVNREVRFPRPV